MVVLNKFHVQPGPRHCGFIVGFIEPAAIVPEYAGDQNQNARKRGLINFQMLFPPEMKVFPAALPTESGVPGIGLPAAAVMKVNEELCYES